jgi:solute carrier family 25 carnitine/acylcarnitine transporter 20/29
MKYKYKIQIPTLIPTGGNHLDTPGIIQVGYLSKMKKETSQEILAGSFGGIIQVLTGQPFDTIKVRLQSSGNYSSTFDCVKQTISKEGLLALYKGTLSPLFGISFCVAIQFSVLEEMKRILSNSKTKTLSPFDFYVAGGVAGVCNSLVSTPVEHIRTRMQVQTDSKYKSTYDCFKQILKSHGVRGLYKGHVVTMLREWQGYGGYFFAYETIMQKFRNEHKDSMMHVLFAGAMAGYGMWIPVYFIDSVKSRIQTDSFGQSRKYTGMFDCFMKVIRKEGFFSLYRGFAACMLRAAPVNAATFLAYEQALRYLKS